MAITPATNAVKGAGDVDIRDVTLVSSKGFAQSITPQVVGIEIFEDIFSTFITGRLVVRDSQDLSNLLPLVGEEIVRLDIRTPTLPDDEALVAEFYVYKMDNRKKTSEREVMFDLFFISKEAIVDLNKKVPKAFSGNPSEIIEEICLNKEYGLQTEKRVFLEDTQNDIKYVSNFWSPTQNIQYVCDHSLTTYESPTLIFFENKYGLNFVALESMYSGGPLKQRFVWDNYTADVSKMGGSSRDLGKDYQRVLELDTPLTFNYMERIQSGMYGSEIITYDLLTHTYVHTGYRPEFEKHKHLNQYPLWTTAATAQGKGMLIHGRKYYNNFDGYGDVTDTKMIQKRRSLLAQAEGFKVIITVFGRTDYSVGQRVILEVPKNTQIKPEDPETEDKIMSGVYLIAALCHMISPTEGHQCVIELVKDSFLVDLNG
jgi:hypothetical protein